MADGISIREFARRAGCTDMVVRRKVKTEHIQTLEEGSIDPAYLEVNWRKGERPSAYSADSKELREEALRLVTADGAELWSKADAERVKENFAARLKQLEYDKASGAVVLIDDVVVAVASEYAMVRNRLLGIGSKIAPDIATLQYPQEIRAIIDEEINDALGQLTVDVDGERDFDKLRESIQGRFGQTNYHAAARL